jgi:transcriptional regulator GlxA family with amidase domain
MKTCLILALDGAPLSSVSGPLEILALANQSLQTEQRFQIRVVSESDRPIAGAMGLNLTSHSQLSHEQETACLILVAAIGHPSTRKDPINPEIIGWLKSQYQQGAEIATICTGAFVLAETGLLDGRIATTHWSCESLFRQRFPAIDLHCEKMITEDAGLMCAGGASAFQDMSLYLIKRYLGEAIAQRCARTLLIDLDRHSQLRYRSFKPGLQHQDTLIHKLQDWLAEHYASECSLPVLAAQINLSERQVVRRFKAATGEAPLAYIQSLRVEQAKNRLMASNRSIEKISHECGYQDVRFFRDLFKRHTDLSPSEYRNKFMMLDHAAS